MTTSNRHIRRRAASGFTLVELMVGMVISMLLILAATSLFISERRTHATQGDVGEIQENARAIAQLLLRQARQIGYTDFLFASNEFASPSLEATNDTGVNASDSLTLRYFGSSQAGADPAAAADSPHFPQADGSTVDCSGNDVSSNVETTEVYSILNDPDGVPWLQCVVNGVATPLFRNVEAFQLLLGEDTDDDGVVNRFVPPGATAHIDNVVALRVSVLLRGASTNNPIMEKPIVNHFGNTYAPNDVAPAGDAGSVVRIAADGRLHRHFTFYIALRNRLP
ncbi:PilW family protein [Cupriavidus sp. 2SB]|uniref:PilW family protein n=1 Tax=Cupriavidus sp. 2SB TaxID=2502199 RepID=UPI0010F7B0B6|nr:PilW family protein [Cupriavidus sp. 2SB]